MARSVTVAACLISAARGLVAPAARTAKAPDAKVVETYAARTLQSSPGGFMESGTEMFAEQFPVFNSYGWGVSVKAERWNGRHAMFGWFFIIATGYCKAHGLIPEPDKLLDFKTWGTLAEISGGKGGGITITNERACILIADRKSVV